MIALFLLVADCSATTLQPGAYHFTASQQRTYDVIVPKLPVPKAGFPVVIALHGANTNPAEFNAITRLADVAGRDPFVLVFTQAQDDTGFVNEVLDALQQKACVDPSRMFAVGHGSAGAFTHRIACDLGDKIAAVAVVSGEPSAVQCKSKRRIPVLQVHGSNDGCAPEPTATGKQWRESNGCGARTRVIRKIGSTTCKVYDGCPESSDVMSCTVEGGGHGWPGGTTDPDKARCGGTLVSDFDASGFVWQFFQDHPLPAPSHFNVGRPATDIDVILKGGKP